MYNAKKIYENIENDFTKLSTEDREDVLEILQELHNEMDDEQYAFDEARSDWRNRCFQHILATRAH